MLIDYKVLMQILGHFCNDVREQIPNNKFNLQILFIISGWKN